MGRTEQKNFHFQVLINKKYLNKQTHLCKFLNFVNWKSSVAPHWIQTIIKDSESISDNEQLYYLQLCWNVCLGPLWGIHAPRF